jgi:anaerobic selenocysteine-containing dehydrogenase
VPPEGPAPRVRLPSGTGHERPADSGYAYRGGAGCDPTPHVQDNGIVKVTAPYDSPVAHGTLRIKGRFGHQYVQNRG